MRPSSVSPLAVSHEALPLFWGAAGQVIEPRHLGGAFSVGEGLATALHNPKTVDKWKALDFVDDMRPGPKGPKSKALDAAD